MNKNVFKFRRLENDCYYAPGSKRSGISNILIFPVPEGSQLALPFEEEIEDMDYVRVKKWSSTEKFAGEKEAC